MRKRTLQLFQLLLAVFGFYAALKYTGNYKLIVPISCLVLLFILDKLEIDFDEEDKVAEEKSKKQETKEAPQAKAKKRLDRLLHNKNVAIMADTAQEFLRELGLPITPCPEYEIVDRMLKIENQKVELGIKMIRDVDEPTENWPLWNKIKEFETDHGGKQRLLLIANNAAAEPREGQQFTNFSSQTRKFLAAKKITAMTTLTLYKVYRLCKETNQDPNKMFRIIYTHSGGVFQLEDYTNR